LSLPNIPDIKPKITLNTCEVTNMLLSSIAMEEIGLSHILNAEGEKLQLLLAKDQLSTCQMLEINEQVNDLLKSVIKSQILLQMKLEEVTKMRRKQRPKKQYQKPSKTCPVCSSKTPCSCK